MTDAGSVATTDRARLEEVNDGRVEGASPCRRLSPAPDLADIRFAAVPGGGCSAESSSCLARCCGWPEQGTGWSPFHSPLTGHGRGPRYDPQGCRWALRARPKRATSPPVLRPGALRPRGRQILQSHSFRRHPGTLEDGERVRFQAGEVRHRDRRASSDGALGACGGLHPSAALGVRGHPR